MIGNLVRCFYYTVRNIAVYYRSAKGGYTLLRGNRQAGIYNVWNPRRSGCSYAAGCILGGLYRTGTLCANKDGALIRSICAHTLVKIRTFTQPFILIV